MGVRGWLWVCVGVGARISIYFVGYRVELSILMASLHLFTVYCFGISVFFFGGSFGLPLGKFVMSSARCLECDPNRLPCRLLIQQKFDNSKTKRITKPAQPNKNEAPMRHWPNCCLILFGFPKGSFEYLVATEIVATCLAWWHATNRFPRSTQ